MEEKNNTTIGFIGAGNMASAIIRGLIQTGHHPSRIWVSNPSKDKLEHLQKTLEVQVTQDNRHVLTKSSVIVIAVKPQKVQEALDGLNFTAEHTVISVAAGTSTERLSSLTGDQCSIIRAMPNTPSSVGFGAAGLFAKADVKNQKGSWAEYVFSSVGKFVWIDEEEQMDIVTAIAGSSPAYFFLMMESLIDAAVSQGLPVDKTKQLVVQSMLGAAHYIDNDMSISIAERRAQVTSPNGTTAAALEVLERENLRSILEKAVNAAVTRGKELSKC